MIISTEKTHRLSTKTVQSCLSISLQSGFGFSAHSNEPLLTEPLPFPPLLHPLHLFKFKHAQLMYKQTGAEIRGLPNPEQAGGTRVSHWWWHATDRRRQAQTIGRVSRWLFDFFGFLTWQQPGSLQLVEDLMFTTLWHLSGRNEIFRWPEQQLSAFSNRYLQQLSAWDGYPET